MKILKKLLPVALATATIFTLSGCVKNRDQKPDEGPVKHEKNPIATMQVEYTNADGEKKEGTVKIELFANEAPDTVSNFVNLVNNKFYDGLKFHRIVENFMIQGGDPVGDGTGSAKVSDIDKSVKKDSDEDYTYSIKGEFKGNNVENTTKFEAGTIAMARGDYSQFGLAEDGYNSASCQFFIMNTDNKQTIEYLQDNYAAFGKVIEGYEIIQDISKTKVVDNEDMGEKSKPEVAPEIKSLTVDTFGEQYKMPKLINFDELIEKVQKTYMELIQQMYGTEDEEGEDAE